MRVQVNEARRKLPHRVNPIDDDVVRVVYRVDGGWRAHDVSRNDLRDIIKNTVDRPEQIRRYRAKLDIGADEVSDRLVDDVKASVDAWLPRGLGCEVMWFRVGFNCHKVRLRVSVPDADPAATAHYDLTVPYSILYDWNREGAVE